MDVCLSANPSQSADYNISTTLITFYIDIHGPRKMKRTESRTERKGREIEKRDGWIVAMAPQGVNRDGF